MHGINFDPTKNLHKIIQCQLILILIISDKSKNYIYLGNIVHGIDWDPIKNLHLNFNDLLILIRIISNKSKKYVYLGYIVHEVDFDPIKKLHVIIQCPVDTDSNHIRQKQKIYLSRVYSA